MENYSYCGKLVKKTLSASETIKLGEQFAAGLDNKNIFLWGELGAGKTTFLKGLGKGLAVREEVASPSFQLVRSYTGPSGALRLMHLDLYRLNSLEEILHLGWNDILDSDAAVAVEWADRAIDILPEEGIFMKFSHIAPDEREIEIYSEKRNIPGF